MFQVKLYIIYKNLIYILFYVLYTLDTILFIFNINYYLYYILNINIYILFQTKSQSF